MVGSSASGVGSSQAEVEDGDDAARPAEGTMARTTSDRRERARRAVARCAAEAATAHELFEDVSRRLRPLLDLDAAAWLVTDPSTILFTDGYVEGFDPAMCGPWYHHELTVPDVARFADLARGRQPVAVLSQQVGGDVRRSARWREVLAPAGLGHELRVAFRDGGACWGVATLHRESARPDFTSEEAELLADVAPEVGAALRRIALARSSAGQPMDGPGLLLVGPDRVPRAGTEAGARWLEVLGVPEGETRHTALLTLGELVTSPSRRSRHIRLRTRDGRWATLHAERLTGDASTFAVIVEPSRSADVATVTALAYGLSAREQETVLALARGETTETIAAGMCISAHTVRDHIKSAFDKTGVGSRNELLARLFHDHYAEQLFGDAMAAHA
jgi:DNA-binding CsgD family transcriptional regulator